MTTEDTVAIVKPDAVEKNAVGDILVRAAIGNLTPVAIQMVRLAQPGWRTFYREHEGKPFFGDLVEFMASGPSVFVLLSGEDAVARWRRMIGYADPTKAVQGTLRQRFGTELPQNAVHGSDSIEAAKREIETLRQCGIDLRRAVIVPEATS